MKLATLCYLKHKHKTLMMHRVKKKKDIHQGKWNGLGGKLKSGESPEECAIREVFEESGLRVKNPILKGILTFPVFDEFEDWYVFVYIFRNFTGKLINSAEGELAWIADDKLVDLNLWEGDYIFLPWLKQKKFFSGKFVYQQGKLIDHQIFFHA